MDAQLQQKILSVLDRHHNMTIATNRPDGWPQATTVGYANEGLDLYFLCGPDSQKARNLARDDRVSVTVDDDEPQVMKITGVSLAGHARRITDPAEARRAMDLLLSRYPPQENLPGPPPDASELALFKVTPEVISLLDYAKGFGHTDLVTC